MDMDSLVNKHYGFGRLMDQILNGLKEAGKDTDALSVDDLAAVDEFHTRGRVSTQEVAQLGNIQTSDLVLDVGCGLGGTARYLADQYKCNVIGIDLTREYVDVGNNLTQRVGLQNKVNLQHGSASALPFGDNHFDVVWTEHVQMNIADKMKFYSEIARVLKPGGRFLFHDIFCGTGEPPVYPAPWADDESISFLVTEEEAKRMIHTTGLKIGQWDKKVDEAIEFFRQFAKKIEKDGSPPIGIHLLMGDNAKQKMENNVSNLRNSRITVAMGFACKQE